MPSLPPRITADLYYDGVWNDITYGLSQTEQIEITRGASSEGNQPEPNEGSALLQNQTGNFSPKNPNSDLFGKIGRNTQIRMKVDAGSVRLRLPSPNTDANAAAADDPALDITGDIDIRIDARLNWGDRGPANVLELAGKQETVGEQRSWRFFQYGQGYPGFGGILGIVWFTDGTEASGVQALCTERLAEGFGRRLAVRVTIDVDNGAGGWTAKFYTAPTIAGPWEQLGDDVIGAGVSSIFSSASDLQIGNVLSQGQNGPRGSYYAAQVYDGIDGTLVADADFTSLAAGTTAWTDSVGRSWALNGGAEVSSTETRLVGEVPAWPPLRTTSGHVTVPIAPAGILRRLGSGSKPLQSAAFRSTQFNDPDAPILEYWPCEDGDEATSIASGLEGGPAAAIVGDIDLASSNTFVSSDSLPQMNSSSINMPIRSYTTTGESQMRFFMSVPSDGIPDQALIARFNCTGSAKVVDMNYVASGNGSLQMHMYDGDGTELDSTGVILFSVDGRPMRFSIGLTQIGSNVQVTMGSLLPNAAQANVLVDTLNGGTIGRVSSIQLGSTVDMGQTVFGHVTFQSAETNLFDVVEQLDAYTGERSGDRINRLCNEQGVSSSYLFSPLANQITLGPQRIKSFVDLITEAAISDQGFLLENRDSIGMNYRSLTTMYNQVPGLILDYSQGLISPPFKPVDDDKLTRNSVVVTVDGGSSSSPQVLSEGPMSTQDPPFGVGLYDVEYTYSLENVGLANNLASWLLHTGTFDGLRYTRITLNLANERVYEHVEDILSLDVGDLLRLKNLPGDLPPDDVDLIVIGYSESIGPSEWIMSFICIPGDPYRIGGTPSDGGSSSFATNANNRADLEGSTLHTTMDENDTNMDVRLKSFDYIPWTNAYPVINSNADMSAGTTGWTTTGGPITAVPTPGIAPFDAPQSLLFSPDGVSSISQVVASTSVPGEVLEGETYHIAFWIYSTEMLSDVRAGFNWYNSSNAYITSSSGPLTVIQPGVWTYMKTTLTAPAGAVSGRARVRFGGTVQATADIYINQIRARRYGPSALGEPEEFPLELRVSGEVVRATSCMPGYHDAFFRDTASGWGTSDSGHVYTNTGGSSSDYSTDEANQEGRHTMTSTNISRRSIVATTDDDCDITVYVGTNQLSTGGSQYAGIMGRYVDIDNLYMARAEFTTDGYVNLAIRKRIAGNESQVGSATLQIPHVAGRGYGLRLYIRGSLLKAQLWDALNGQAVDREWDIETGDADLLAVGTGFGFRSILSPSNTNVDPVIAYAFPKNNYPQRFIVERSINGVVKSLPATADVNVDRPMFTTAR